MSTFVITPTVRPARARRAVVRAVVLAAWAAFGFSVVFATVAAAPWVVGRHSFSILSGSMVPTLDVGDEVVDKPVHASAIRPGDIVTFRDPDDPSRLLTHRVIRFRIRSGIAYVVTRGDANRGVERWSIPAGGSVGRVEYRIPKLGYALQYTDGRFARFMLVALPAFLLGLLELKRLWFPKERRRHA